MKKLCIILCLLLSIPLAAHYPDFSPIVDKVRPAVVTVIPIITLETGFFNDGSLNKFFGLPIEKKQLRAMGTGFIISKDGFIVTNNHVVEERGEVSDNVTVITADGREWKARIIGTDLKTDLALLRINGNNLPIVELGDSSKIKPGECVIAIGNPYWQILTVTAGIISAKGRQLMISEYVDFIQTDAAINPGNSGGPLFNTTGKVIGVNAMMLAPQGSSISIGFSIPVNIVKKVVKDIKRYGKVIRGWWGIQFKEFKSGQNTIMGYNKGGLLVTKIAKNSPADKAGLKIGDFIIKVEDKVIKSSADLMVIIVNTSPEDILNVTFYREGKELSLKIKVVQEPVKN